MTESRIYSLALMSLLVLTLMREIKIVWFPQALLKYKNWDCIWVNLIPPILELFWVLLILYLIFFLSFPFLLCSMETICRWLKLVFRCTEHKLVCVNDGFVLSSSCCCNGYVWVMVSFLNRKEVEKMFMCCPVLNQYK